ncbi:hypothetical protein ABPG72_002523 [Tetrahymena utriculariae]
MSTVLNQTNNKMLSILFLSFLNLNDTNLSEIVQELEPLYLIVYYPLLIILIDLNSNSEIALNNKHIIIFTIAFMIYFIIAVAYLYGYKNKFGRFAVNILAINLIHFSYIQKILLTILVLVRCSYAAALEFGVIVFFLTIIEAILFKLYTNQYIKISKRKIINWIFTNVLDEEHFNCMFESVSAKNKFKYCISSKATLIIKSFLISSLFLISTYSLDKKPLLWLIILQTDFISHHLRYFLVSEKVIYQNNSIAQKAQIIPFIEKYRYYNCNIYVDYKKQLKQGYQQLDEDKNLSLEEQIKLLKLLSQFKDKSAVYIIKYDIIANSKKFVAHNIATKESIQLFLYESTYIPEMFFPRTSYLNLDFKQILINRSILLLNDDCKYEHFIGFYQVKKKIQQIQFQIMLFHKILSKMFGINPSEILYDLYGMEAEFTK